MPTRDEAWPQGTPCWVDLGVDDVEAARTFYTELFGWDLQDGPPEAGGYLMALKNGRPAAGLGPKMGDATMPTVWTTYLAADSADDIAAKVAEAGGQVFMPAFDVMDVGRMLVAADPTGAAFGVWEAGAHIGAGVFNETGAYCWNEVHTRDYAAAKDFYASVFGYTYQELGDGETFAYSTFTLPGGEASVGGINDSTTMPGDHPSYWLAWFQVDGLDSATAKAVELGSTVITGPNDSPSGRMSIVRGPQGEVFGLIDPAAASGGPSASDA